MLMTVEIDQVQAFVAIVRGGGFTRAASILHLSQPAVSRRLNLLERELGAPLFERIRSGVILTEAGRTFLPHAEGLLACMRDGLDSVRALYQVDRGTITLALVGTLASTTLTACLERFRDAHPRVELRLRTALSQEVSVLVRRGDTTLGLRYGGDPHAEILATPIYDEPMMVVCSPRHRLARRRSVAPSALGNASRPCSWGVARALPQHVFSHSHASHVLRQTKLLRPWRRLSQYDAKSRPMGLRTPIPVTTARRFEETMAHLTEHRRTKRSIGRPCGWRGALSVPACASALR